MPVALVGLVTRDHLVDESTHLKPLAKRLRRLPGLLVTNVGVAHGRTDILVAEELLDFPQILFHVVKEDCGRGMP